MHDGISSLRRVPWSSPSGDKPAYIDAGERGKLAELADEIERGHLADARDVLAHARTLLAAEPAYGEVFRTAERLAEALLLSVDVAVMRGERLGMTGS